MKTGKESWDLQALMTGYHLLLATIFGRKQRLSFAFSNKEDLITEIQNGSLPAPLTDEAITTINQALETLSEKEEQIIKLYFGINSEKQTLEQIGKGCGVSRERIRTIKEKALHKLRHPTRTGQLKHIPITWADVLEENSVFCRQIEEQQVQIYQMQEQQTQINKEMAQYRQAASILYPLSVQAESNENDERAKLLQKPISDFKLSARNANCLAAANIQTVGDLVAKTEDDMLKYRHYGRKSLNELKAILEEMGLSFKETTISGI